MNHASFPHFISRSLAAIRLVEDVRGALLCGDGPDGWAARLQVHLLVFEGVCDQSVLDQAVMDPDGAIKRLGKTCVLRDGGQTHESWSQLQEPTLRVIAERPTEREDITAAGTCYRISLWLCKTFRAEWDRRNELRAWNQLVCCFSHWAAYYLPSAVNSAYNVRDIAPALNVGSMLRLAGDLDVDNVQHIDVDALKPVFTRQPRSVSLTQLARPVHTWGDGRKKLDEMARAGGLREDLSRIAPSLPGSPFEVTRSWLDTEGEKALHRDGTQIEIASLSTYFSNLHATLESIPALDDIRTWEEEDFEALCDDLRASVRANGRSREAAAARAAAIKRKLDAAKRMMLVLHGEGYRVPKWVLKRPRQESPSIVPGASVLISGKDFEKIEKLIRHAATGREWLYQELSAMLHAQYDTGCRTAEVDLLERRCVLAGTNLIVIRPVGFSHIKRKASIRLTAANEQTTSKLNALGDFRIECSPTAQHLFLGDDENHTDHARQLNAIIAASMRLATGDTHAVQHALRGGAMTRRAFPGWENLAEDHLHGMAGPLRCREFFGYATAKWTAPAAVSSEAGHAERWRFLLSYFAAWPVLRALALAATLPEHVPTAYVRSSGMATPGALATKRHYMAKSGVAFDEWLWMAARRPPLNVHSLLAVHKNATFTVPTVSAIAERGTDKRSEILYLAGRLLGLSSSVAALRANVDADRQDLLELKLSEARVPDKLRARVRAPASARGSKADKGALDAFHVEEWLSAIGDLDSRDVQILHELLIRDAHNLVNWEAERDARGAVERALQALPSCLGLHLKFGVRRLVNPVSTSLQRLPRVEVALHRDHGNPPHVFVIHAPKDKRTSVSRARLTVLYRVLTFAYLLTRS